jgi:hypothetical protein
VAVQPWVCLITTLKDEKNAVKGERQRPAGNNTLSGELLTTVANISNWLPTFTFAGEGRVLSRSTPEPVAFAVELVFIRSTPEPVAFAVELGLEDWEYAFRSWPNGKLKMVIVMSVTKKGIMKSCFSLQNCINHYILLNYLCLSIAW